MYFWTRKDPVQYYTLFKTGFESQFALPARLHYYLLATFFFTYLRIALLSEVNFRQNDYMAVNSHAGIAYVYLQISPSV